MAIDTPAVVLGAGANGLGVARSLARERMPVWLLDSDVRRAEMYTRVATPLKVRGLQGEALIEDLERLGAAQFSGMRPVLLLTQEETVKTVSHHRDRLSGLYRFSLPPPDVVDALLHKQGFQRLAEKLGGPIPPLVHVRTLADLPALENLRYPVVVKPGERHAEYGRQFKKAYRVENVGDASALLRRILAVMADVVVQEWIEGPDSNIYFCLQYLDQRGRVAASFTGRKIRSWPPQVGGTASCTAAPEAHAELTRLTTRFFQGAGVVGMAGMEYKRDERTREFRMVEPTIGRTDYQEEVATLNGVNLPYAAYCSELGLPFAGISPHHSASRRTSAQRANGSELDGPFSSTSPLPSGERETSAQRVSGSELDRPFSSTSPLPSGESDTSAQRANRSELDRTFSSTSSLPSGERETSAQRASGSELDRPFSSTSPLRSGERETSAQCANRSELDQPSSSAFPLPSGERETSAQRASGSELDRRVSSTSPLPSGERETSAQRLAGEGGPSSPVRHPIVWRVRSEDLQSAALQGQHPGDGVPQGSRVADALFRWGDPLPALVHGLRHIRRALHTRTLKITQHARPVVAGGPPGSHTVRPERSEAKSKGG